MAGSQSVHRSIEQVRGRYFQMQNGRANVPISRGKIDGNHFAG